MEQYRRVLRGYDGSAPAEWEEHRAVWIAGPSHPHLWEGALEPVREAWLEMAFAIADQDLATGLLRGERLEVLVPDAPNEFEARSQLAGLPARFHRIPFGDIWLRDIAPVFVKGEERVAAVCFAFNGWGGKYVLPDDDLVSARVALAARMRAFSVPWVLEGGAVEVDGAGTCLTTRQCLLNPNRNPGMAEREPGDRRAGRWRWPHPNSVLRQLVILLAALLLGLLAGHVLARGRRRPYRLPDPRHLWLVPAAFLPQMLAVYLPAGRGMEAVSAAALALPVSLVVFLIFVWLNRRIPGMLVLLVGLVLNLLVITANGGWMPVSPETASQLPGGAPP